MCKASSRPKFGAANRPLAKDSGSTETAAASRNSSSNNGTTSTASSNDPSDDAATAAKTTADPPSGLFLVTLSLAVCLLGSALAMKYSIAQQQ